MRRLLPAALLLAACSSPPMQVCVPGRSEACTGPGACAGFQVCNASGMAYDPCDCSGGAGGGSGGATGGGSGGATGGGSGGATGGGSGGATGGGSGGATGGGSGGATGGGSGGATGGGSGGATGGGSGGATGGGNATDGGTDAGMDAGVDAGVPCDPVAQTGCGVGQKCTWVILTETPTKTGALRCVANGTVVAGGACTNGPAGPTTGFDDCVAGNVCINTTCTAVCDFTAGCGMLDNCSGYTDLFANGEDSPTHGACTPGCNPVTQLRTNGTPCPSGQGCYLLTSSTETVAVCAGAGTVAHNQTITGTAFANSCVPGAQPRRRDQVSMTVECGGLCNPAQVTSTMNQQQEGGAEIPGNPTAKDNCQTSWGAAPPGDGVAGESCRYWWMREPFNTIGRFSNTVGWCFKHAVHQYDTNGDMVNDAPYPRCVSLTTGDVVPPIQNPPGNDALDFGCIESPSVRPLFGPPIKVQPGIVADHEPQLDRIGNWR